MPKGLLKEISRDELIAMRESGMTNSDIANSLGVCYSTIYRLIGAQPGVRRKPHTYADAPVVAVDSPKQEETHEACLVVENRTVKLAGLYASYVVDVRGKTVEVRVEDDITALTVSFDELSTFVQELSAIDRRTNSVFVGNEMW